MLPAAAAAAATVAGAAGGTSAGNTDDLVRGRVLHLCAQGQILIRVHFFLHGL